MRLTGRREGQRAAVREGLGVWERTFAVQVDGLALAVAHGELRAGWLVDDAAARSGGRLFSTRRG